VGIPRTLGLLYSPWRPLGIPSAITPIGQLHQSPPSHIPGDRARSKRRGFSPGAAARQLQHARACTDIRRKQVFFLFWWPSTLFPKFPQFLQNNLFCHLPDFPHWPVPTASPLEWAGSPYRTMWEIWEMTE